MTERQRFEAWAKKRGLIVTRHAARTSVYLWITTDEAWRGYHAGYQAAKRQARKQ